VEQCGDYQCLTESNLTILILTINASFRVVTSISA
jgi:hypothetical protein